MVLNEEHDGALRGEPTQRGHHFASEVGEARGPVGFVADERNLQGFALFAGMRLESTIGRRQLDHSGLFPGRADRQSIQPE